MSKLKELETILNVSKELELNLVSVQLLKDEEQEDEYDTMAGKVALIYSQYTEEEMYRLEVLGHLNKCEDLAIMAIQPGKYDEDKELENLPYHRIWI